MLKINLKYEPDSLMQFTEDMKALSLLSEHFAIELNVDAKIKE